MAENGPTRIGGHNPQAARTRGRNARLHRFPGAYTRSPTHIRGHYTRRDRYPGPKRAVRLDIRGRRVHVFRARGQREQATTNL